MKKFLQVTLAVMAGVMMTGCQKEEMVLKNEYKNGLKIEYGTSIPSSPQTYLDNSEEYIQNTKLGGIPKNEDEKNYPAVGEYNLTLTHDKDTIKVKLSVVDTTKPVFIDKVTKQTVEYGKKIDKTQFKADDLSKVTISVDDSKVNYKKAGTYKAIVTATDDHKNTTSKDIEVTIKAEKKKESASSTSQKVSSSNKQTSTSSNKSSSSTSQSTSQSSNTKPDTSTTKPSSSSSSSQNGDLWVSNLKVAKNYSKIMIASAPSGSSRQGTFAYYKKVNGKWKESMKTTAYFGSQGVGQGHENSRRSPVGQYTFTKLMGLSSNPGTKLPYHKIDNNDYWCGETLYNQFVDEDVTQHNCSKKNDEHLADYTLPYRYVAAFSYNPSNIKGKGFAYFLHSKGNTNYTGGCVAIANSKMQTIMQEIDNDTVFIIDLQKNITKY